MKPRLKLGMLGAAMASLVMVCWLGQAEADSTIIIDRGMPVWNGQTGSGSNLNGTTNTSRVNITSQNSYNHSLPSTPPPTYQILGDDFSIGYGYQIDSIKVWMVYGSDTLITFPSDVASNLKLWVGPVGGTLTSHAVDQFSIERFYYPNPTNTNPDPNTNYQRLSDSTYRAIWSLSFPIDPNTTLAAGTYEFFLDGLFYGGDNYWHNPSLHLANTTQMGADNKFYTLAIDSGVPGTVTEVDSISFGGYSHGADANVQVYGHTAPVPLPGTLLLLGSGLLGLAGVRRRFKRN